jgi:hypothetical protein
VLEEGGRPARLCDVVGVIDSWQHMILRPDELADSVVRLSASGLISRVGQTLTTSDLVKSKVPRDRDGRLSVGSASAGKWTKLVLRPIGG